MGACGKRLGLIIIVCPSIIDTRRCPQACRNNLVQHLDHLLFYGADMNARNASGNTPLHVCAVNNTDASCIRQLLFRGAQKDSLNYANQTPYQVAVIAGNMELAEVIKNYQPDEVGEWWRIRNLERTACVYVRARDPRDIADRISPDVSVLGVECTEPNFPFPRILLFISFLRFDINALIDTLIRCSL